MNDKLTLFFGKTNPELSNFYVSPFEIDGTVYNSSEHYFMYQKAKLFDPDGDAIKKMSPTSVYISYGLNDLGRNYAGGYVAKVQEEVKKVRDVVPHAKIYICAIIPVNQALTQKDARWQQIPTINRDLKKMCKKQKWIYVADDTLANESIYAQDGMHFQPSFYQTWAETILDTTK